MSYVVCTKQGQRLAVPSFPTSTDAFTWREQLRGGRTSIPKGDTPVVYQLVAASPGTTPGMFVVLNQDSFTSVSPFGTADAAYAWRLGNPVTAPLPVYQLVEVSAPAQFVIPTTTVTTTELTTDAYGRIPGSGATTYVYEAWTDLGDGSKPFRTQPA